MSQEQIRAEVDAAVLAEMARPEYQEALKKHAVKPEFFPEDSPKYAQLKQDMQDEYIGLARRFCAHHKGAFIHDNTVQRWFRWANGTHWDLDLDRYHLKAVADLAPPFEAQAAFFRELADKAFEEDAKSERGKVLAKVAKAWDGKAKQLKEPTAMKKVLDLASAGADSLGITGTEWNKHPNLLVTRNAVIDLETAKQIPTSPSLYLNQHSPVEWAGLHAESELWDAFLDQVFLGDQQLIEYVQTCVGYWISGYNSIQEFWTLWGPQGRNGKGVFFRRLRAIMGNYYVSLDPQMLMDTKFQRQGGGPNPEMVNLRFKRLAVASESKKGAVFSMDAIKRWTGGDPIPCRGMNSDNILELLPEFKLLFVTNRLPQVNDATDNAFRSRLRIIKFLARFTSVASEVDPERHIYPMDPQLERKLDAPEVLSAILAWAVRGAKRFFDLGMRLEAPLDVLAETDAYMEDQDLIGMFIRQALIVTDGGQGQRTPAKDVYLAFRKWCIEDQLTPEKYVPTLSSFGRDFKIRPDIKQVPPKNLVVYNVLVREEWQPKEASY
jgi:putative DNA primase/helicase